MLTTAAKPTGMPTLHGVYEPIEAYRESLPAPADDGDPAAELSALDAYLVHLVLNFMPERPTLVDLAADATRGATTVLGLVHPRVRRILTATDDAAEYRNALEHFRAEHTPRPGAALEPLPATPGTRAWPSAWAGLGRPPSPVFLLAAGESPSANLTAGIRACLEAASRGLALVLNLGPVGSCEAVRALLEAFGNDRHRLWLLREQADALLSSRLGLVACRDNGAAEEALRRVRGLFTANFDYLSLVRKACLDAVKAANVDEAALKAHPTGWLVEYRAAVAQMEHTLNTARGEVARLKNDLAAARYEAANLQGAWERHGQACQVNEALRWELHRKEQELATVRASLAYRMANRVARVRQRLAPEGGWRFRCYRRARRGLGILRAEGLRGFLAKAVRKCLRRA